MYWPEELATFEHEGETIVIVWAVPVTLAEQRFIASHGWAHFEDLLTASDPGLLDLNRKTVAGVH